MRAKKSLGQNFLIDPNYRRKIVAALAPSPQDVILEIGGGKGMLSEAIAPLCKQLIVVEKDERLASDLVGKFSRRENVQIIAEDFLELDLEKIPRGDLKVVGNLPYNVASQIFIKLIENRRYISEMFLMFQKEMALRFVAKPSTKDYGLLTLWAQIYTDAKILFHLPPTVFSPRPKVKSSFVSFRIREKPLLGDTEAADFFKLMRLLFQHRRKMIRCSLTASQRGIPEALKESSFLKQRPEELTLEELLYLHALCATHGRGPRGFF